MDAAFSLLRVLTQGASFFKEEQEESEERKKNTAVPLLRWTLMCILTQPVSSGEAAPLHWQIHLMRRDPARLPVLLLVLGIGGLCTWLIFGAILPVLAALVLLTGSVSEYLFPLTYHLNAQEIGLKSVTTQSALPWQEIRRCRLSRDTLFLTTMPEPSRLDAFRGVLLRFAPDGQTGDRDSVLAAIANYAPHLKLPEVIDR